MANHNPTGYWYAHPNAPAVVAGLLQQIQQPQHNQPQNMPQVVNIQGQLNNQMQQLQLQQQQQNPLRLPQNALQRQQNPGRGQQNPGRGQQNPGRGQQNPGRGQQNPGRGQQNAGRGQQPPGPPPPIIIQMKDYHSGPLLRLRAIIEESFRSRDLNLLEREIPLFEYLDDKISLPINGDTLLSFCIYNELYHKATLKTTPKLCSETDLPINEADWPIRIKIANFLLSHGFNPNLQDKLVGWSSVHACANKGDLALLQLIDKYELIAALPNYDGQLPATLAFIKGFQKTASYLDCKSLNLMCQSRRVVWDCLGRSTGIEKVQHLPILKNLKVFIAYDNPYPGYRATKIPPRIFSVQDLQKNLIPSEKISNFLLKNASQYFLSTHTIDDATTCDELVTMYEELYDMGGFKSVECKDEIITSRYIDFMNGEVTPLLKCEIEDNLS